jgi:hypothetical protein
MILMSFLVVYVSNCLLGLEVIVFVIVVTYLDEDKNYHAIDDVY